MVAVKPTARSCRYMYGVTAQIPLGMLNQRTFIPATMALIARARSAVPRLPRFPDTGAGPFCKRRSTGCKPMRDVEFDFWKDACGLTSGEVKKLRRAFRGTPVHLQVRRLWCCWNRPAYPKRAP